MRVLIVEDERPAADRLQTLLYRCEPAIEIAGVTESIEETVEFLKQNAHPDLMLLDIHLSDGHCFEIFKQINCKRPVIFTSAYDEYALEAFRLLSIDYLLKPIAETALKQALDKFRELSATFSVTRLEAAATTLFSPRNYKQRFLGKVGQRLFFINAGDVAFFEAANKIVYLVDANGNRYVIEHTMEKLIELLDPSLFFRLNRSFIVHIKAIQQVKPYYNNRLRLLVMGASPQHELVIARERVTEFKQWAEA